ncbi:MAG: hypothetical protein NWE76_05640 [Candidatus Bathyarchaeota archaeon]|nr:hypothetical protein [Candidatus Bathyarchaeota archaeon]
MTEKIVPNLKMHPFNTTLMGVLKGVSDYFKIPLSAAWLFGGSGHAFLINIHEELCPSGPYVWNYETFFSLAGNLGIEMKDLGFFHPKSTRDEIKQIEETLKKTIDDHVPCSLLNLENQLISGYNDQHFVVQQPWSGVDFPPKTLTFRTWEELGDEFHISFFSFAQTEKTDKLTVIKDSLKYAVDLFRNPSKYRHEHYYIGLEAYETWIKAVEAGQGPSHGNWWNGTVWWECREMASEYFSEIASEFKGEIQRRAMDLSKRYGNLAKLLNQARDKKLPDDKKIETILESRRTEEAGIREIEEFTGILPS